MCSKCVSLYINIVMENVKSEWLTLCFYFFVLNSVRGEREKRLRTKCGNLNFSYISQVNKKGQK